MLKLDLMLRLLIVPWTLLVIQASSSLAATISVPGDAAAIQDGIDMAMVGDTVLVAPGIYTGARNKDLDFLGKDIALIGSGSSNTIIDCEDSGRGLHFSQGETNAALVYGITIVNGYIAEDRGGGVLCEGSAPTFRDIVVRECYAMYTGGICLPEAAPAVFQDCIIEENSAQMDGGGLCICNGSDATFSNVIIRNNHTNSYGGAALICYSSPRFFNTTFAGNESWQFGGGVCCLGSPAEFYDCQFLGNNAGWEGGALYSAGPALIVDGCTFYGNWADELGGAISLEVDWGSVFRNCLIEHNTAGAGGAAYVGEFSSYPPSQFINVTMVGNRSWWAAGATITANWQGKVDLVNCIIVNSLGGQALWTDHGASIDVTCCDLWGNSQGNYGGDMTDQTGTNGNLSVNPFFCDADASDYTLASGSPCLPPNNDCGVQMGAFGVGCEVTGVDLPAPLGILLESNYPNPFNSSTTISFALREPATITVAIFDIGGRLIRELAAEESVPAGHHERHWDGLDTAGKPASSGLYFYRLETDTGAIARSMLLVK